MSSETAGNRQALGARERTDRMAGEHARGDATGARRGFLSAVGRRWPWMAGGTLAALIGSAAFVLAVPPRYAAVATVLAGERRPPRPRSRGALGSRGRPSGYACLGRPRPRGGRPAGARRESRVCRRRRFGRARGRCVSLAADRRARAWIAGDRDHVRLARPGACGAGREHGRRTRRAVSERGASALLPRGRDVARKENRRRQDQGRRRRGEGRGGPGRVRTGPARTDRGPADQASDLNAKLAAARAEQSAAAGKATLLRNLEREGRLADAPPSIADESLRRLLDQRVALRAEIADASRTLLPLHPRMKDLAARLAALDGEIRDAADEAARASEAEARRAGDEADAIAPRLAEQVEAGRDGFRRGGLAPRARSRGAIGAGRTGLVPTDGAGGRGARSGGRRGRGSADRLPGGAAARAGFSQGRADPPCGRRRPASGCRRSPPRSRPSPRRGGSIRLRRKRRPRRRRLRAAPEVLPKRRPAISTPSRRPPSARPGGALDSAAGIVAALKRVKPQGGVVVLVAGDRAGQALGVALEAARRLAAERAAVFVDLGDTQDWLADILYREAPDEFVYPRPFGPDRGTRRLWRRDPARPVLEPRRRPAGPGSGRAEDRRRADRLRRRLWRGRSSRFRLAQRLGASGGGILRTRSSSSPRRPVQDRSWIRRDTRSATPARRSSPTASGRRKGCPRRREDGEAGGHSPCQGRPRRGNLSRREAVVETSRGSSTFVRASASAACQGRAEDPGRDRDADSRLAMVGRRADLARDHHQLPFP